MLDDLLTLFRRRRSPGRRRKPPVDSLWGINLSTLGGLIGLGRPDRIPRTGPAMKPRRAYQETDDWQPASDKDGQQDDACRDNCILGVALEVAHSVLSVWLRKTAPVKPAAPYLHSPGART